MTGAEAPSERAPDAAFTPVVRAHRLTQRVLRCNVRGYNRMTLRLQRAIAASMDNRGGRSRRTQGRRTTGQGRQACACGPDKFHPQHHRRRPGARHLRAAPVERQAGRPHPARKSAGRPGQDPHALSAGAQRLSAHRPRQEHLPELRAGARLRRALPHALRRHQPGQGRPGVRRRHPRHGALARLRLGARCREQSVSRERLLRGHVSLCRAPDPDGLRLRRRADRRRNARDTRHAYRARHQFAVP